MKKISIKSSHIFTISILAFLWTFVSALSPAFCQNNNSKTASQTQSGQKPKASAPLFTLPRIPAILTQAQDRADYLVTHYWDHYKFSDTTYLYPQEIAEQIFVDYIDMLRHASPAVANTSIKQMLVKAQTNKRVLKYFTDIYEKYWYDPNSPMRNEAHYTTVLESVLASNKLSELEKTRFRFQWEQVRKNPPGKIAIDFSYISTSGLQAKMHAISSDYLIIFFYNPGCHACEEIQQELSSSPVVQKLLQGGRLKILAMYIDEDIAAWQKYVQKIPKAWINAYDAQQVIRNQMLYDLRAIPNIYLIDKGKKVVLKDANMGELMSMLAEI